MAGVSCNHRSHWARLWSVYGQLLWLCDIGLYYTGICGDNEVVNLHLHQQTVLILLGFFSALHEMPARTSDEKVSVCPSVSPSVRLSNAWIVTKRKKDLSRFYTIRKSIYPSFLRRRMVGERRLLLPEILGQPAPVGAKSPILNR